MQVFELLSKARNTLQDYKKNFWDDSELLDYYEDARRVIASERHERRKTQTVVLNAGDETYSPVGVLRYISIKDNEGTDRPLYQDDGSGTSDTLGVTIIDYDQILVHDDTVGSSIDITYIGIPEAHNLNDDVRQGDETALRYYVLARAYEKESDMQNFQKSDSFFFKFKEALQELVKNSAVKYQHKSVQTTKQYYY